MTNLSSSEPNNQTKTLCLYFQLHQPIRLNLPDLTNSKASFQDSFLISSSKGLVKFTVGPSGDNPNFLYGNSTIFEKVTRSSYIPGLRFWLAQLGQFPKLKITFGLSGTFLEQVQRSESGQEIIFLLKSLIATERVEILAETYYHSLASLFDEEEFIRQIKLHTETLQKLLNYTPSNFRNTELIFNPQIGKIIQKLGYKVQIATRPKIVNSEILGNKKIPALAVLEKADFDSTLKLALANFEATMFFFFTHRSDEFKEFFLNYPERLEVLGTDFEIFGEHNGGHIFDIWTDLLQTIQTNWDFATVSDLAEFEKKLAPSQKAAEIDQSNLANQNSTDQFSPKIPVYQELFPNLTTSWTNSQQNLISWLGNDNQDQAFGKLQEIYQKIKNKIPKPQNALQADLETTLETELKNQNVDNILLEKELVKELEYQQIWDFFGKLTTSDNFYYMSDLDGADGPLHAMFNAYPSPQIAFETFWQILLAFETFLDNF
jgi:alpha-amylase